MGLLTSLKNFLRQIKWRKKRTKQSETLLLEPNEPALVKDISNDVSNIVPEEFNAVQEVDNQLEELNKIVNKIQDQFIKNISYMNLDNSESKVETVDVITNQDHILDFVNGLPTILKDKTLKTLSSSDKEIAIFLSSEEDDGEKIFVILLNILKESSMKGLLFISSTSKEALSAVLSDFSNLTITQIENAFDKGDSIDSLDNN